MILHRIIIDRFKGTGLYKQPPILYHELIEAGYSDKDATRIARHHALMYGVFRGACIRMLAAERSLVILTDRAVFAKEVAPSMPSWLRNFFFDGYNNELATELLYDRLISRVIPNDALWHEFWERLGNKAAAEVAEAVRVAYMSTEPPSEE